MGLLGGATVQAQVSHCLCLAQAPGQIYEVICSWQLPGLVLETPERGYAVNWGWLLLELGCGSLSKWYQPCMPKLSAVWGLWTFSENLEKSTMWAKASHL